MNFMQEKLEQAHKENEAMKWALSNLSQDTHDFIIACMEEESVRIYAEEQGICVHCGLLLTDCNCI